ncbi:ATP-binding cassette domain-containing protein [Anaerotruncus massiliensis (ex Liu et al. 2021)]|uniref:ATP-binding cassette domain-containing protein n=2 Tax=Anaerotruncus TaxID=244127 RepID=A0A498CTG7_9FIRM|nr:MULTISPECIES: ATP-binding cassette domain-containing protein [Anaerotruncus]MBC3937790.1 ATP-binding cassette domain-containing protein [Anaerotruncus massiliensis (ex Togo et al. 2019)]RLL13788.1 ATP-binding cassette domain-containing protein [Anaerotruncus massiliensis (ex Liu et al. 2021)]
MLELQNITVDVDDSRGILRDVSLKIDGGKFVVITGPNGGGKSTLARVIAGITRPAAGRILFDGEDITDLGITERARRGVGFAFQQPVRFKGLTVRDLVELAAGGSLSEQQLCGYLSDVGLCAKDYIDREVNASLSGGEIKRIEIASVMARKTRLTIFDEPEAGIDLWSFQNLIGVFQKMRRETSGSLVVISHQERILEIADELVVLVSGVVTAHGPREEILPGLLKGDGSRCAFCPQEGGICHE